MAKAKKYRVTNKSRKRAEKAKLVTFPSEEPMSMRTGELSAAHNAGKDPAYEDLVKMYGKPGVPTDDPVVDLLGRVNGQTYPNQPSFLEVSVKQKPKTIKEIAAAAKEKKALANLPKTPAVYPPDASIDPPKLSVPTLKLADKKVQIVRDSTLTHPVLCFKIFVQPDPAVRDDEARFAKMFARAQCRRAESVLEADLVIFGGGSDVDPALYNETRHPTTYTSVKRDTVDMDLYLMCVEHGIPMLGICRGAQFLHVMNGGKLWQDVDNHNTSHPMWDLRNKQQIEKVSSVHHQMVRENVKGGMEIIATASRSSYRCPNREEKLDGANIDIEAFFYRDTCCIGIQGHPEYQGYNYFTKWSLDLLEELVFNNPDLEWTDGGVLRMKKELLVERQQMAPVKVPLTKGN